KTGGYVVFGKSKKTLRDSVISNFAGPLAEVECNLAPRLEISGKDKETIRGAIRLLDIFPEGVAEGWTKLKGEAHALVRKHRGAIEQVAQALMEHQTLNGEQLGQIISSAVMLPPLKLRAIPRKIKTPHESY